MFIYIYILSYYNLFLYFILCLSVMLDSVSCLFTSISFLTTSCSFTLCPSVMLDIYSLPCSFTSKLSILNEHIFKYNRTHSKFWDQCNKNHTETNKHCLLHCNQCTVSRTTLLLGIKHILCPDLNISPLQGLCPIHRGKIMTDGSDDLTININYKRSEIGFQYIKSRKKNSS